MDRLSDKAIDIVNALNCLKEYEDEEEHGKTKVDISGGGSTQRYPRDVLRFSWDTQKSKIHNCQKPIAACEYFIKTYTNINDIVLDNCIGSGTTAIACINTVRKYLGFEADKSIYNKAYNRIFEYNQYLYKKKIRTEKG